MSNEDEIFKERQVNGDPAVDTYNDGFGSGGIRIAHKGGFVKDLFFVMIPWDKLEDMLHKIQEQKRLKNFQEVEAKIKGDNHG